MGCILASTVAGLESRNGVNTMRLLRALNGFMFGLALIAAFAYMVNGGHL